MKTNELQYKGFFTTVNYEAETNTFYGKLEGIKDLVTWESEEEDFFFIYTAFAEAVDDYLEFCNEVGAKMDGKKEG